MWMWVFGIVFEKDDMYVLIVRKIGDVLIEVGAKSVASYEVDILFVIVLVFVMDIEEFVENDENGV